MDYKNMDEPVSKGLKLFGHIDILINNAGVSYRGEISSTQIQVDERVMAVNYFGQVALIKGENNWVFLAHLSQKLKRAFLIKICPLSVVVVVVVGFIVVVVVNFSHFHLLLQNHWVNFNQTWHKHLWVKGIQVYSNEGPALFQGEIKIHWQSLKIFLYLYGNLNVDYCRLLLATSRYIYHTHLPVFQFFRNFTSYEKTRRWIHC